MPLYCYSTNDGETVDRFFHMGDAPETVRLDDGRVASRDRRAERIGTPARKGWPLECEASGVHPDQAGELRKFLADRGCPTDVSKEGNPIYRDAGHRRRALALRGFHDRNSFC